MQIGEILGTQIEGGWGLVRELRVARRVQGLRDLLHGGTLRCAVSCGAPAALSLPVVGTTDNSTDVPPLAG